MPNFLIFHKFASLPSQIKVYERDYSKFSKQTLLNDIQRVDWNELFGSDNESQDPSLLFRSFYDTINHIVDKHIPLRELGRNEIKFKSKPWITKSLRKSIQNKNKINQKFPKTKS